MMKGAFCLAAVVLLLTSCNKESGPESRTPATFGKVFFPERPEAGLPVRVQVPVESEYGFSQISIFYTEEDTPDEVKESGVCLLPADTRSFIYEGTIPKTAQKAGKRVTFRVRALTAYEVPSYSEQCVYTVSDEETEIRPSPIE